jgi:hypothetical protein
MKKLIHGFWNCLPAEGQLPNSREQSSAVQIKDGIYLFGGFARDVFSDIKFYSLTKQKWFIVDQKT